MNQLAGTEIVFPTPTGEPVVAEELLAINQEYSLEVTSPVKVPPLQVNELMSSTDSPFFGIPLIANEPDVIFGLAHVSIFAKALDWIEPPGPSAMTWHTKVLFGNFKIICFVKSKVVVDV